MANINIYNTDCMTFMASLPDKAYELAIVDPPYGIGKDGQRGDIRPHGSGKYNDSKWTRKSYEFKGWDIIPRAEYFTELMRVSVNQIVWGGNYFTEYLRPVKAWVFWYKGQHDLTMSDGEMAWTSFSKVTRHYELNRMALNKEGTIHPTQKPVALYKWLLKNYAKQGDKILDTHGGSCSIAIACDIMGFDLDVCELDTDYYNAAVERFERHKRQGVLQFD
jgi:site-specific DNA-methyltransferase (adenine-specific)